MRGRWAENARLVMKKPANETSAATPFPTVHIPTIKIPQPDGSLLLKRGQPQVLEDEIGTAEAAKILGMGQRIIEHDCDVGLFKTAYKPSAKKRGRWKIARAEVWARKQPPVD
jgi:hypothetical protein